MLIDYISRFQKFRNFKFWIFKFRNLNSEVSNCKLAKSKFSNSEVLNSEFSNSKISNSEVLNSEFLTSNFHIPNFHIPNFHIPNVHIPNFQILNVRLHVFYLEHKHWDSLPPTFFDPIEFFFWKIWDFVGNPSHLLWWCTFLRFILKASLIKCKIFLFVGWIITKIEFSPGGGGVLLPRCKLFSKSWLVYSNEARPTTLHAN